MMGVRNDGSLSSDSTFDVKKHTIRRIADAIAELFKEKFSKCNRVYTPDELITDMNRCYGVTISYKQAYSGCKRQELIRGLVPTPKCPSLTSIVSAGLVPTLKCPSMISIDFRFPKRRVL